MSLQKFVQLYAAVSTPMRQRNVVFMSIGFFALLESASFRQLDLTTVTISLKNASFKWLLRYIRVVILQDF